MISENEYASAALLFLALISISVISGCVGQQAASDASAEAKDMCIYACGMMVAAGQDMSDGPCLMDPMPAPLEKWVCDVAHEPRWNTDNLPENQCESYRNGSATAFVEVTPSCTVIRAVGG